VVAVAVKAADDDALVTVAGFNITYDYAVYILGLTAILLCCVCCCMMYRCRRKERVKRKSQQFNKFFAEVQPTPAGPAPRLPAPPTPDQPRRSRPRGLSRLVSNSFIGGDSHLMGGDNLDDDAEGSVWSENLKNRSSMDDAEELDIYGRSYETAREPEQVLGEMLDYMEDLLRRDSHHVDIEPTKRTPYRYSFSAREPGISVEDVSEFNSQAPNADIFTGSQPAHRRSTGMDGESQNFPAVPRTPVRSTRSKRRWSSKYPETETTRTSGPRDNRPRRSTFRFRGGQREEIESPRQGEESRGHSRGEASIEDLERILYNQDQVGGMDMQFDDRDQYSHQPMGTRTCVIPHCSSLSMSRSVTKVSQWPCISALALAGVPAAPAAP